VLGLPTGLRQHMADTVAVARLVAERGDARLQSVARSVEIAMALHDVGNVVKGGSDGAVSLAVLHEPEETRERWTLYTAYMRARYGHDDHRATAAIHAELGVRAWVTELVERKASRNLPLIVARSDPADLLALYADMRAGPHGPVSIEERHREAVARYAGTAREGLGGTIRLDDLRRLEAAVTQAFGCRVEAIADADVKERREACLELEVHDALAA
jgi:hypothetical protein